MKTIRATHRRDAIRALTGKTNVTGSVPNLARAMLDWIPPNAPAYRQVKAVADGGGDARSAAFAAIGWAQRATSRGRAPGHAFAAACYALAD